jgi:hypothetical protein
MSNGFASALEISARIVRENGNDHTTARRLITERLQNMDLNDTRETSENSYLLNMREGYKAALARLYAIAQWGEG